MPLAAIMTCHPRMRSIERLSSADSVKRSHGVCCKPAKGRPLLLTSAGQWGTLITDIRLSIDPAHRPENAERLAEEIGQLRRASEERAKNAELARHAAADPGRAARRAAVVRAVRELFPPGGGVRV